jgi:hypothetical protein
MAYLKINDKDFSPYVRELKITKKNNYNAQTNAAGNTVVDYINRKREFNVGFIYVDDETMQQIQEELDMFNVFISFRNPDTGALEEDVDCIIPNSQIEYFTIQANRVLFKEFSLTFQEL